MSMLVEDKHRIWVELANLFFFDQEPTDADYQYVSSLLKDKSWSKEDVLQNVVEFIAPHVASNVGHGFYPVIGLWDGFDEGWLIKKIEHSMIIRQKYPKFYFGLQDKFNTRLVHKLGIERLLSLLD